MKRKYLTKKQEYQKAVPESGGLIFANRSPFEGINLIPNSFLACHAPCPIDELSQVGTTYVVRMVNEAKSFFDIDVYQNFFDKQNVVRTGPHKELPYHHSRELPGFLQKGLYDSKDKQNVCLQGKIKIHEDNCKKRWSDFLVC